MFGAIAVSILTLNSVNPTLAADPFRTSNPHPIGNKTEAAFKAIFKDGDYIAGQRYLQQAESSESNDPLVYAMQASLAYANKDLNKANTYGQKTLTTAQQLITSNSDPLRGNLYAAVGQFLQGAATLVRDGTVKGTPQALVDLQRVYDSLDKAEAIDRNDPEVNLIRGYMDLMIAVNLPFSNPEQAIERLDKHAQPRYLVERGLALGYRDLNEYDEALGAVDRALQASSGNPDLFYLKGQILVRQGQSKKNPAYCQKAIENFDRAIAKKAQLPATTVQQLERERRKAATCLS
jgi:tetratricopeptide (TPR) repeat protein